MSRKSLLLCFTALAVMLLGLGIAIAFLYSGVENHDDARSVSYSGSCGCVRAIPSDAVLVTCFSRPEKACGGILSGLKFPVALAAGISDGTLASLKKCPFAASLHYSGKLYPLYAIECAKASEDAVKEITAIADGCGLHHGKAREFMLFSESETLVKSALRHVERNVSIADDKGFAEAMSSVGGKDFMIIPAVQVKRLMTSVFTRTVSSHSPFMERVADWYALEIGSGNDTPVLFDGTLLYDGDTDEFLTVLEGCEPSCPDMAEILPSYTVSALSFPFRNMERYMSAYRGFVDSRQGLQNFLSVQKTLGSKCGIMPEDLFKHLEIREICSASFISEGKMERVNLIRIANRDLELIFKGNEVPAMKGYTPEVHSWAYPSFIASVFGKLFSLPDESCFTFANGWIITGSRTAIEEYVLRGASDYTLSEYLSDADAGRLLSTVPALATAYFSFSQCGDRLTEYFKPEIAEYMKSLTEGHDACPAVLTLTKDKKNITASFALHTRSMQKTKAPSHDRDTVVTVPAGPFVVKNSHTGKMNTFYQNSQKAICLRDETGKDLWGVPFGKPLCGTAHNVDYYANGKLQIIFGAGSSIYIIDRLGRYVSGFPLDLGKEITLGPDIYDFSGARKYNIMLLHKDNTIQMYNLKGKKPEAWKGITAGETIKALPERLTVGNKDFWVVRTSIQTLIFPFYGGEALTVFEGDSKIRPDSKVIAVDGTSVQATSYDGKTRTIRLI